MEADDEGRDGAAEGQDLSALAAQFDTLLAGAPLGIGVFDTDCRHVRVNAVLAEMNGRPGAAGRGQLLAAVSEELAGHTDAREALAALPELLVPSVADWCLVSALEGTAPAAGAGARVRDVARLRDVAWHHRDAGRAEALGRYARARLEDQRSGPDALPAALERALRDGRPAVVPPGAGRVLATLLDGGAAGAQAPTPDSGVVVPLVTREGVLGVVTLCWDAPEEAPGEPTATPVEELGVDPVATRTALGTDGPDAATVDLLRAVADRTATALDAMTAAQRQREIAEELQRSCSPSRPSPTTPRWWCATCRRPGRPRSAVTGTTPSSSRRAPPSSSSATCSGTTRAPRRPWARSARSSAPPP